MILVFTQVIDEERADGLEEAVRDANLELVGNHVVRTLAQPRTIGPVTMPARGLEELVRHDQRRPTRGGEAGVRERPGGSHLAEGRPVAGRARRRLAPPRRGSPPRRSRCPTPRCCAPSSSGCWRAITAIFGIELSNDQAAEPGQGTVGQGGMELAGKRLVKELAKHVSGRQRGQRRRRRRAARARSARPTSGCAPRCCAARRQGKPDARRRGGQVPDGDVQQAAAQTHGR